IGIIKVADNAVPIVSTVENPSVVLDRGINRKVLSIEGIKRNDVFGIVGVVPRSNSGLRKPYGLEPVPNRPDCEGRPYRYIGSNFQRTRIAAQNVVGDN